MFRLAGSRVDGKQKCEKKPKHLIMAQVMLEF